MSPAPAKLPWVLSVAGLQVLASHLTLVQLQQMNLINILRVLELCIIQPPGQLKQTVISNTEGYLVILYTNIYRVSQKKGEVDSMHV